MGYHKDIRNQKYWDGLRPWNSRCYKCAWFKSEICLNCRVIGSGEQDYFFPANCMNCAHANTNLCEECEKLSNHQFEHEVK